MDNERKSLPMVALRGMTILPEMVVHFDVSRERSIAAVQEAMTEDQKIFLAAQKSTETENPGKEDVYEVGTVAAVKQIIRLPKHTVRVLVAGEQRGILREIEETDPCLRACVEIINESDAEVPDDVNTQAMERGLKDMLVEYAAKNGKMSKESVAGLLEITGLRKLTDEIAANIPLNYKDQQELLSETDFLKRYEKLAFKLVNEVQIMNIKEEIQRKVKERVDRHQREYILREQLKLIREELGEDRTSDAAEEYKAKLEKLEASDEVKEKIAKEIDRFKGMTGSAAESSVLGTYIETLLSLPWDHRSQDSNDLKEAWKILEEGHYGLKDVKERIMEFLSVRKLTSGGKTPILCLVGPPGTGKTSIAKSVAEALHKKYVRICLGGVRDEAEIRGHRKTYVGAMPGRITAALQQAGVSNPLMLLDEIDKTSSDYRGDVSSALLEVLDPEQNMRFNDHYVEISQDLSEVLFIATANDMQEIPRPLLDRMEVIEISGYTENEKEHIAKEHLIPKQMEINGIQKNQLSIQTPALRKIINQYTKEAGVRSLERKIGQICRKAAREIMENGKEKVTVNTRNLETFLGRSKYSYMMANKKDEVGIARGLAWTQVGGDTLQIEVNVMPGKGELVLTGQLGDVMKESAQAGISYIRSVADEYGIAPEFFQEHDIHVHIPEGAVPKDGPSAGITMATAMLSAVIQKKVRADIAMTGEITLRGRVLPIGGLKEKLLAAKYAKIKEVLVPGENKGDIQDMDPEILEGLKISYVDNMTDVIHEALRK